MGLKMQKIIKSVFILCLCSVSIIAKASIDDTGHINFHGKLVAESCILDDKFLSIELGDVQQASLLRYGHTQIRHFKIRLSNCSAIANKTVTIAFTGISDGNGGRNDLLQVNQGESAAKGLGVGLFYADNTPYPINTIPDRAHRQSVVNGEMKFDFGAAYVRDNAELSPGDVNATATIRITYR